MPITNSKKIFIVAGETSGDILGGYLATALQNNHPAYQLTGVGGKHMKDAGVDIVFDCEQLAVVGFTEVLKKLGTIRRAMQQTVQLLRKNPPALLILIDYPGFNLRLAAKAKALGIRIMYYVSPQIWAWRYNRIKTIKKYIDLMTVLFPFEEKIYQAQNIPVKFVGHPLLQNIRRLPDKITLFQEFQLNSEHPVIGLLPGSRHHEIQRLLPDMLASIPLIRQKIPAAQFVLPLAPNLPLEAVEDFDLTHITVIQNNTHRTLQLCNAAIVASGTATLEVAMLNVPQVIVYRLNTITYYLAKRLAKVKNFGLCNIVAETPIAPELLQQQVTPEKISEEILSLLTNNVLREKIQHELSILQSKLITSNAAKNVADAAMELIKKRSDKK